MRNTENDANCFLLFKNIKVVFAVFGVLHAVFGVIPGDSFHAVHVLSTANY